MNTRHHLFDQSRLEAALKEARIFPPTRSSNASAFVWTSSSNPKNSMMTPPWWP